MDFHIFFTKIRRSQDLNNLCINFPSLSLQYTSWHKKLGFSLNKLAIFKYSKSVFRPTDTSKFVLSLLKVDDTFIFDVFETAITHETLSTLSSMETFEGKCTNSPSEEKYK